MFFLLQIGASQPPVCAMAQTDYTVSPAEILRFRITGSDPDPDDRLAMYAWGLPYDSDFEIQGWPDRFNPVTADFSWRPLLPG